MKSRHRRVCARGSALSGGRQAKGSISLLITGDEEGPAINGTPKMLDWLKERGETLDHCVVGEPTATARAGDTLKIGRRGSITRRRDGARACRAMSAIRTGRAIRFRRWRRW